MASINAGYAFTATEQVTAAKLRMLASSGGGSNGTMTISGILGSEITDGTITNVKIADVSGAKLTNMASIPSGAGVIPAANLPTMFTTGMIMLWSGSIVSIPTGWLLCNGSSGTPDLRDKFVIGAGSTYAVAATGGAATKSISIAEANLPSHAHAAGTLTGGAHTHTIPSVSTDGSTTGSTYLKGVSDGYTIVAKSSGSAGAEAVTGSTGAIGSGTAISQDVLNPYYALAYIMKS